MAQPEEDRGISRRPRLLDILGIGRLSEDDARARAREIVRAARSDSGRSIEGPAPDSGEVRERREARIRRESHQES